MKDTVSAKPKENPKCKDRGQSQLGRIIWTPIQNKAWEWGVSVGRTPSTFTQNIGQVRPMAPVRPPARRLLPQNPSEQGQTPSSAGNDPNVNNELFIDPMLGTPLAVYIEKDVEEKDELVRLVTVS